MQAADQRTAFRWPDSGKRHLADEEGHATITCNGSRVVEHHLNTRNAVSRLLASNAIGRRGNHVDEHHNDEAEK